MLWYYSGLFRDYSGLFRDYFVTMRNRRNYCVTIRYYFDTIRDYLEDALMNLGFHNHVSNLGSSFVLLFAHPVLYPGLRIVIEGSALTMTAGPTNQENWRIPE